MADLAIIAIEADMGAARLLAQDLRAAGVEAEAIAPADADTELSDALALVFFASDAALQDKGWRGVAALSAARRFSTVVAALSEEVDEAALSAVLPTDRVAFAQAKEIIALLGAELGLGSALEGEGAEADAVADFRAAPEADEEEDAAGAFERVGAAPPPSPAPARKAARPAPFVGGAAPLQDQAPTEEGFGALKRAKLFENAPRRMKVGRKAEISVRISPNKGAEAGMDGEVRAHSITAAQVMTVTLDNPDFAFAIQKLTPETQWIDRSAVAQLGLLGAAEAAEWRWSVEAIKPGAQRLAISASARIADANGVVADASLPPEIIDVRVSIAPARIIGRTARWVAVAVVAAVLGHYGVAIIDAVGALLGAA